MKEFKEYITAGLVKKQKPDSHVATATKRAAIDRIALAKALLNHQKPKFVVENAFESIREYIDALLFLKGYKSYSHEASIAYLADLKLSATDIGKADMLRKHRNGIKYYGDEATKEQAVLAIEIADDIMKKIEEK